MVHGNTEKTTPGKSKRARPAQPSTPRRQRKKQERTEEILSVAERLIAQRGLEALSLNAVARELDIVPGALYRYFGSKDDLVGELHRRTIEELHERFRGDRQARQPRYEGLDAQSRSLAEVLGACDFYLSLPDELPERFRFVSLMLGDPRQLIDDEDVPQSARALMEFLADIRRLFEAAHEARALMPASALDRTLVLWSSLQGVLQLNKMRHYSTEIFDSRRLSRQLVEPLLLGWGADPTALERAQKTLAQAPASR